jgi:hypothetical protein
MALASNPQTHIAIVRTMAYAARFLYGPRLLGFASLASRLDSPKPRAIYTPCCGVLSTSSIRDACEYMTGMDKKRELRSHWQRVCKLILAKEDVLTVSRALELALFMDAKLGRVESPSALTVGCTGQPTTSREYSGRKNSRCNRCPKWGQPGCRDSPSFMQFAAAIRSAAPAKRSALPHAQHLVQSHRGRDHMEQKERLSPVPTG